MTRIRAKGMAHVAAALGLAAGAGCVQQTGTAPDWPTSPDFPRDSLVPSQLVGSTYNGWEDQGGAWITDAGPGWDELWQLVYGRAGQASIVIVTPDSYTADGSVENWRVRTSLLMASSAERPMTWEACRLVTGPIQPVYARWVPGTTPTDVWTFTPQGGRFTPLPPDQVICEEFGPE